MAEDKPRKNIAAVSLGRRSAQARLKGLTDEQRKAAMRELAERRWKDRKPEQT